MRCKIGVATLLGILSLFAGTAPDAAAEEGAVFAMTNAADDNEIVMFHRDSAGLLTMAGRFSTGGLGSGGQLTAAIDPLASQNSLLLDGDRRRLFAVNAGSNEISMFAVGDGELVLLDRVDSGGSFPVSLTVHGRRLYVLNSGGDANVTGFTVGDGSLLPLPGSTRALGFGGTNPPGVFLSPVQVEFAPGGKALVVVVNPGGVGEIRVFRMDRDGLPAVTPATTPSVGEFPFGFGFDRRGRLLVTEAAPNSVSSYAFADDGTLEVVSASVPNFQFATCWITEVAGRYAYVTNTASHNISAYRVREDGTLTLVDADGVALQFPSSAAFPVDVANAADRFLYTVNAGDGTVGMLRVQRDGGLTFLGEVPGLPVFDGAQGIDAY